MWNKDEVKGKARRKAGELVEKAGKVIAGPAVTGFLALTLLGVSASLFHIFASFK